MRVRELADWLHAPYEGDGERDISGVAPLESAGERDLSFVTHRKAQSLAEQSEAGCLLVARDFPNDGGRTVIRVEPVRAAFARAVGMLHVELPVTPGIHQAAVVGAGVTLGEGVSIGPHACIGEGARLGDWARIGAGCAVGRGAEIGAESVLHSHVTLYDHVRVGARCILHSGCVIGADGFGFALENGRYQKFPQVGSVEIGDDCEIGANTCIDRAALGVTTIGEGTKLDNMVHVAHNCRIGRHVVVAAQTGFSGSVVVEDYAVVGGQVGIGDKARIESRAVLGSGCGVLTSKIIRSGQVVWGTPARPLKEYLEQLATLARLPELRKEIAELKRKVQMLAQTPSLPRE